MKAAVMHEGANGPVYEEVAAPVARQDDEILVTVKAVAVKHLDKARATGKHYSKVPVAGEGHIVGGDGVCLLPDGTRVYAMGVSGMMAEKAVVNSKRMVPVPPGLDDATAAALPNAVIGSAMGLHFKAGIQPGDVVLINGATGFTGRVAVQLARHYGAARIIGTGRNPESLKELQSLGVDEAITLNQEEEDFKAAIKAIHAVTPINIVIDYLWGHPAEMLLACFKGDGGFTSPVKYVAVGGMAGDIIQLSAAALRSCDLQLTGSGLGSWSRSQVDAFFSELLPAMFELAAAGKLTVRTTTIPLNAVAGIWDVQHAGGTRLVVNI